MKKILLIVSFFILIACESNSSGKLNSYESSVIKAKDAIKYVGDYKTVCGKVVSGTYASSSRGNPTFLNLDKSYPNHYFTIVIWGKNRSNFSSPPENMYLYKDVCVEGIIETYRGKAQIEISNQSKINFRK